MSDRTASQFQFLIKADGICGSEPFWANKSGGNVTAESRRVYGGGKKRAAVRAGRPSREDITITRHWDPFLHTEEAARLEDVCGQFRTTLSIQSTDSDLVPVGEPNVHPDSLLVEVHPPEADSESDDDATWELVFAVPY